MANVGCRNAGSLDRADQNTNDRPQQMVGEQGADHAAATTVARDESLFARPSLPTA